MRHCSVFDTAASGDELRRRPNLARLSPIPNALYRSANLEWTFNGKSISVAFKEMKQRIVTARTKSRCNKKEVCLKEQRGEVVLDVSEKES
jgi:hypothetical protein